MQFTNDELNFLKTIGHSFNPDQLEEIRCALHAGISISDIEKIVSPKQSPQQIRKTVAVATEISIIKYKNKK